MISLLTNVLSQSAQTANKSADRLQSQAMQRLSTGSRVNSAQDDAAGLAIGVRMTSTINASNQLIKGIADGISLVQVAEGALHHIGELLQRMRELSLQAATDTLTPSDRSALDLEFQALNQEIDRISRNTQIFDRYPLAPPQPAAVEAPLPLGDTLPINLVLTAQSQNFNSGLASVGYIPKGFSNVTLNLNSFSMDDDLQIFTTDGKHLLGTPILTNTDPVWADQGITNATAANNSIMETSNGFDAGASYDGSLLSNVATYNINNLPITNQYKGMTLKYSGDGAGTEQYLEKITIDVVTENLVVMVIGNGSFSANGTWTEPSSIPTSESGPFSTDTHIVLSAPLGRGSTSITLKATPSDTTTLGTARSQITTANGASAAIQEIDLALQKVNENAVNYGALMSRMTSATDNLMMMMTQTSASRSRIMDTDYALESAKLATQQILQESSTAMLAQANALPNTVLSLLDQQLG